MSLCNFPLSPVPLRERLRVMTEGSVEELPEAHWQALSAVAERPTSMNIAVSYQVISFTLAVTEAPTSRPIDVVVAADVPPAADSPRPA